MVAELLTGIGVGLALAAPAPPDPAPEPGERIGTLTSQVTGNVPMIEGTSLRILSRGSGHLDDTGLPGGGGVTSWWAHRVTPTLGRPHGPFYDIDQFKIGQRITLRMKWGVYRYRVTRHLIIHRPTVGSLHRIIDRLPDRGEWALFAACHPKGSAAKRYVVVARLARNADAV